MKPTKINFTKQQYFDTDEAIDETDVTAISSYGSNTSITINDLPSVQFKEYTFNISGSGFLSYIQIDVFVSSPGIAHDLRYSLILDGVVINSAYYRGTTGFQFNFSKEYTNDRIFVRSGVFKLIVESYGVNISQVLANGNVSLIG